MKSLRIFPLGAAAVVALLAPLPALAQQRAVVFSARGGGFSALTASRSTSSSTAAT